MRCPNCSSSNIVRYRSPRIVEDVIIRRHSCLECKHIFASAQLVVIGDLAERLATVLDA